jgi:hypothetical protein
LKFKLAKYTTNVSAERSIAEIEKILANFGAEKIMKDYLQDGRVTSISFMINGKGYKLPTNQEGVFKVLFERKRSGVNATKSREERAYRVSWRILKDWIYSQLSIIASGQAEPEQVLLPYMWNGKQTFFEAFKDGKLQLGSGKE